MSLLYKVDSTKMLFRYVTCNFSLTGEWYTNVWSDIWRRSGLSWINQDFNTKGLRRYPHSSFWLTKFNMFGSKFLMTAAQNQHCFSIKSVNYIISDYVYSSNASGIWGWRKFPRIPWRSQSARAICSVQVISTAVKVDDNCGTQSWNNEAWQWEHVIPRCPGPFSFVSFVDG